MRANREAYLSGFQFLSGFQNKEKPANNVAGNNTFNSFPDSRVGAIKNAEAVAQLGLSIPFRIPGALQAGAAPRPYSDLSIPFRIPVRGQPTAVFRYVNFQFLSGFQRCPAWAPGLGEDELSIPFRIPEARRNPEPTKVGKQLSIPFRIPEYKHSGEDGENDSQLSIPFRIPVGSNPSIGLVEVIIFQFLSGFQITHQLQNIRRSSSFQFLSGFQLPETTTTSIKKPHTLSIPFRIPVMGPMDGI